MPRGYARVERWERIIMDGREEDFTFDEDTRVARIRKGMTQEQAFDAGFQLGREMARRAARITSVADVNHDEPKG